MMGHPAVVALKMGFRAGPENHTFYACEEHRAELERGDVSLFFLLKDEEPQPVDPEFEEQCYFCLEG